MNSTKIKRILISILLAILIIFLLLGVVYVASMYADYVIIITFIMLPIGVLAEAIYRALSEY